MTAVLVHGNPETAAIWRPLLAELAYKDVITFSPPGFGAPVSEGFAATFFASHASDPTCCAFTPLVGA